MARNKISNSGVTFKDVPGWPGYRVSSDGWVWTSRFLLGQPIMKNWRRLKGNAGPYYRVVLCNMGKYKRFAVHRLVAEAFLGPAPSQHHQINHIDGNKLNNDVLNLEWVTHRENTDHAIRTRLRLFCERHQNAKLTNDQAREILALRGQEFTRVTAKRYGVCQAVVSHIQCGRSWKTLSRKMEL